MTNNCLANDAFIYEGYKVLEIVRAINRWIKDIFKTLLKTAKKNDFALK